MEVIQKCSCYNAKVHLMRLYVATVEHVNKDVEIIEWMMLGIRCIRMFEVGTPPSIDENRIEW